MQVSAAKCGESASSATLKMTLLKKTVVIFAAAFLMTALAMIYVSQRRCNLNDYISLPKPKKSLVRAKYRHKNASNSASKVSTEEKKWRPLPLSTMNMRQMWRRNKNVSDPGAFADPRALANCRVRLDRKIVFKLLKQWIEFTAKHNLYWFLVSGTLIGAQRHADVIPYDHDVDIAVFSADEAILRKFQTKRTKMRNDKMNIILRPGYHDSPSRMNCQGRKVSSMGDTCSFTGPIARLMLKRTQPWIDVFAYHLGHLKANNNSNMAIYSEEEYKAYPIGDILPLKQCRFLRMTVLCPQKPADFLRSAYENTNILTPNRVCKHGSWTRI